MSAVSIGNHMMALYNLSNITNKQLKDMGKIMFFIKVSLDEDDKKDIFDFGQEYNEIFAWFIWNHYNHEMVSEFKKVIALIQSDIECFCDVILHQRSSGTRKSLLIY
jgi:formyltetrahydrofolate hydrolase